MAEKAMIRSKATAAAIPSAVEPAMTPLVGPVAMMFSLPIKEMISSRADVVTMGFAAEPAMTPLVVAVAMIHSPVGVVLTV